MNQRSIFLSAGEPSGDNAAARLVSVLDKKLPGTNWFGLGGVRLKERGQEQLADSESLAVLGFWEIVGKYNFFLRLLSRCESEIEKRRPAVLILVDYPGFNLRLAQRVRHLGIPIVYYISPQVWAWGRRRLKIISRVVDKMLLILPFEQDYYKDKGVSCSYVGHYLMEDIPDRLIRSHPPGNKVLALLPGSRRQEIERMLIPMFKAARKFCLEFGYKAEVAAIAGRYDYQSALAAVGDSDISICYEDSREMIARSDIVLVASGTATLETAIIGRPMVVVYKTGMLTYAIARSLVKIDSIALVNLVLGEKVVPELIQHKASTEAMYQQLCRLHNEKTVRSDMLQQLHTVPDLLGGEGASERAAEAVVELIC